MSKQKNSKLDPFAERLDQWFTSRDVGGDGLTFAQAQEQLRQDGCSVSVGRLSEWWRDRQRLKEQELLLQQISTGAGQVKAVEKQFGENPAPEMETLIRLHRVLILKLSTQGNVNPEFLKLADQLMRTAMEYTSGQTKFQQKERELAVAEGKFQVATCEFFLQWFNDSRAHSIANSSASNAEKISQLRQEYFKDVDALQKSGRVVLPE